MSKLFGSQAQQEWAAYLEEARQRWVGLGEQTAALCTVQEEALREFFGAGLSDAAAAAEVANYLRELKPSRSVGSLAEFVQANQNAKHALPPAVENVPALIAALQEEWEQMFSRLHKRLASPRGQTILAARKPPGMPPSSLHEAVLYAVKDIAPLHDPDENRRVPSLALDAEEEKAQNVNDPPKRIEGVGDKIADKIREHLHLHREIKKLADFWTGEAAKVAAFCSTSSPLPTLAPVRRRVWWKPWTWFRRSVRTENADPTRLRGVWREPVPPYVPVNPKLAHQLREWRARTEREAEDLRAAEAGWTHRVTKVGEELAARCAAEARHPPLDRELEAKTGEELQKARELRGALAAAAFQKCSGILARIDAELVR